MKFTVLFGIGIVAATLVAGAQEMSRPEVPDAIKAPAGENVVMQLGAIGSQIYTCQMGADNKYAWTLKAPEADLRDAKGLLMGKHLAGPTWKLNDGSEIVGKAAAKVDSPNADSIPWLLVHVVSHSGEGKLSRVTSVQRVRTHGGQAPPAADCSAASKDPEIRVAYTADYIFYAPSK